jgi:SAM-dependent methyltransferase
MNKCRFCGSNQVDKLLDFGLQPISNRFLAMADEAEALFPLGYSLCTHCGLLQLTDVTPAAELQPRVDWITYNEAEGHLDHMVDRVLQLINLPQDATIYGISYKDSSTLERFRKRGFHKAIQVEPGAHLGITTPCAGIETVQDRWTPEQAQSLVSQHGKADLIICRHILEHAHDPARFTEALRTLLKPGATIVFEVPDASLSLKCRDYSTIWEEHVVYFTPITYRSSVAASGFVPVDFIQYDYPLENSLVIIARNERPISSHITPEAIATEIQTARTFAENYAPAKKRLTVQLDKVRREKGPIAVFGAGHLACKYINLLGLKSLIDFVADDHPKKKGLFMPGSHLPILASATLRERKIALCLLSLNPESEEKVMKKNQDYVAEGGTFASIFPASPSSLKG